MTKNVNINLSWNDTATGENGFRVYQAPGSTPTFDYGAADFTRIDEIQTADTETYIDTGMEMLSGLTYTWYDTEQLYNSNDHPSNKTEFDNFFDDTRNDVTFGGTGMHTREISWGSDSQTIQTGSVGEKPSYLPTDDYSWIAEGILYAPESGSYEIGIDGDDAVDILIDGTQIVGWYGGHGFSGSFDQHTGTVNLTEGYHNVVIRHQEGYGGDGVAVAWIPPSDTSWTVIPVSSYFTLSGSTVLTYAITAYNNNGESQPARTTVDVLSTILAT